MMSPSLRRSLNIIAVLILLYSSPVVYGQDDYNVVSTVSSTIPSSQPVELTCLFENEWSAATHPVDYPNNAHWSPMVLASHSTGYQMWAAGTLASPGVQSVAETGATSTLESELESAGQDVADSQQGSLIFVSSTPSSTIGPVLMDSLHPFLSSITMMAPSPDWFTGFNDFSVLDGATWLESFVITTYPWDAGTDSGNTYAASNQATTPPENMFQLTATTVPDTDVLLSPDGSTVDIVATWSCTVSAVGDVPTVAPTVAPTVVAPAPTVAPTMVAPAPTVAPTTAPTVAPTAVPTVTATTPPTIMPVTPETLAPTVTIDATSPAPSGGTELPTVGAVEMAPPSATPSMEQVPTTAPTATAAPTTTASPTLSSQPTFTPIPRYEVTTVPSDISVSEKVNVTCAFQSQWTRERHPNDYPNTTLWSPMVLASHSDGYEMWGEVGVLASPGVTQVAETGNFSTLRAELDAAGTNVLDQQFGTLMDLTETQEQSFGPLQLDFSRHYISTISMMAPSPDWFSGFASFSVMDPDTETWYASFVIETYPWDAGTDSGDTYESEDMPIDTPLWIYQLTVQSVPPLPGVYLSPNGTTVLPVATWACNVQHTPEPEPTSGSTLVRASWALRLAATALLYSLQ